LFFALRRRFPRFSAAAEFNPNRGSIPMSRLATGEPSSLPARLISRKKVAQMVVVIALIVAAGVGGAFYYFRYGDKTESDAKVIAPVARDLLKIEVPPRLWPKLMVTRPDVMTMVVFAPFKDSADPACLAIARCLPEWAHERGNRANQVLQTALQQYFPQFETERWKDTETREIPIAGQTEKVKIATSYRVEGHKEVRIVSIENLVTDKGVVALYYQTPITSTADDDIEIMLKSMN
jgi:hypothetical protein